ncbi:MAG TPA: ABC transporter substrate-binding protein, partial [Bacillota bacterium]
LDDVRVRQALNYALDKEAIRDYFGVNAIPCSFVVEGYVGHAEDVMCYPYDPEKAKQLLAEAGYPNGFDLGVVTASTRDVHIDNYLLMQDMWSKIGVTFEIERVDHSTWHAKIREGQQPFVEYGFVRPLYAHVPLYQFFHSDAIVGKETAITNFSYYDGIDALLDEAAVTPDLDRRIELWQEAQRKLAEEALYSPLVQANRFLVTSSKLKLGYEDVLKDNMIPTQWYFPIITEQTELLD